MVRDHEPVAHVLYLPERRSGGETYPRRADAVRLIDAHRDELRDLSVGSLSVFGSVARDEARSDSDIDLLVEFTRPIGFFHLYRVQHRLEEILGVRVDLTTPAGLRPELREAILGEAVRAA